MPEFKVSKTERRSRNRLVKRLDVRVRNASADHTAQTRDISTNGVFLYTRSAFVEGADVELVLMLPSELTAGEKCWVCCHAQVCRVEQIGQHFGVAAEIQRIEALPEIPG
jgi:Tfp pilus assembly protein PilZ